MLAWDPNAASGTSMAVGAPVVRYWEVDASHMLCRSPGLPRYGGVGVQDGHVGMG